MSGTTWEAVGAWLAPRLGEAPEELAESVRSLVGEARAGSRARGVGPASLSDALAAAAILGFEQVVQDPARGNERGSALRLLAADAVLTYAFEAAAGESAGASLALARRIGVAGVLGDRLRSLGDIERSTEGVRS